MPGLSHKDDELETPPWLIKGIENETGLKFDEDLAASPKNTKCKSYMTEELDTLNWKFHTHKTRFCNPPRSKNGKFVTKIIEIWKEQNDDIVMLLCWNDLGNIYCNYLRSLILAGSYKVKVVNLGKMKFYKNGVETKFTSRLAYFWVWFKKK